MTRIMGLVLFTALYYAQYAWAVSIVVGHHHLQPDTPGQEIDIFVSDGGLQQGVYFRAQLGDGGPPLGGDDTGPSMSGTLIGPGMIFFENNLGEGDSSALPLYLELSAVTAEGFVSATGLLGTITIDTTGWSSGTWTLVMSETEGGPTHFVDSMIDIMDGSITIVPEPHSIKLAMWGGVIGLAALARRLDKCVRHFRAHKSGHS